MNVWIKILPVLFVLIFGWCFSVQAYDPQAAVRYANVWWDGRNLDDYADYDYPSGGDCANFVSQCLIAGGLNLSEDKSIEPIYLGKGHTIANCDALHRHLAVFRKVDVTEGNKGEDTPDELVPGDIVIFGHEQDP